MIAPALLDVVLELLQTGQSSLASTFDLAVNLQGAPGAPSLP